MEVPCKPGQEQPRAGREKQPASASFIKIPRAASNRKFTRAAALSLRAQGQQNKDSTGKPVCFPSPPPRVPAAGPFWLPGFPCCVGHRGSPRRWPGPGSQPCFPFRKRKQRSSGKVYFKRRLFGRHRNSAEGRGLILSCPVPLQQGVPKPGSGIIDSYHHLLGSVKEQKQLSLSFNQASMQGRWRTRLGPSRHTAMGP